MDLGDPLAQTSLARNARIRRPRALPLLVFAAISFWSFTELVPRAVRAFDLDAALPPILQLALIHLLGLGSVIALGSLSTDARLRELFPLRRLRAVELAWLLCTMAGISILGSEAANWVLRMSDPAAEVTRPGSPLQASNVWLTLVVVAGVVPWTEELLFRGLVLEGLRPPLRAGAASLVSACAFAAFHFNVLQMPLAFVAGVLLAQWRILTASLLPCIVGHAFLNAFPYMLTSLWGEVPGYGFEAAPSLRQPWSFNVLGAVLLVVGLMGMFRMRDSRSRTSAEGADWRARSALARDSAR